MPEPDLNTRVSVEVPTTRTGKNYVLELDDDGVKITAPISFRTLPVALEDLQAAVAKLARAADEKRP